jgi:hypothetical protein
MIAYPGHGFYDHRDTRGCPHVAREAVRARTTAQGGNEAYHLLTTQARLGARPPRCLQSRAPAGVPRLVPAVRRLPAHPELARDRCLRRAASKPSGGLQSAGLEPRRVSVDVLSALHATGECTPDVNAAYRVCRTAQRRNAYAMPVCTVTVPRPSRR